MTGFPQPRAALAGTPRRFDPWRCRRDSRFEVGRNTDMGEITDHVVAYRNGQMTLETLCTFLASYPYRACPPFGWWRMWAGPHALEDTVQEMLGAAGRLLTDVEYVALIRAIKHRPVPVRAPGEDDDG